EAAADREGPRHPLRRRGAVRLGLHAPLLRLRERRPAHQRAARVPPRRRARPGRDRHHLPRLPRPARGPAGQAAGGHGEHERAGRGGPRARHRRGCAAGPGRGAVRRPRQVLDPGRHPRGRARGHLPGQGAVAGGRAGAPAVRAPGDGGGRPGGRPRLQDLAAGAGRLQPPRDAPPRDRGGGPRPRQALHRHRLGRRHGLRQRQGPLQEGGRAAGGPGGVRVPGHRPHGHRHRRRRPGRGRPGRAAGPGAHADERVVPALPGVNVLAETRAARLGGARVAAVRVVSVAALKTFDPPIDALVGLAVTGAGRRAKYVWLEFGDLRLVMHLSLGGRLTLGPKPASRKVAVLTVEFDAGRVRSMTEGGPQRRAAVWLVDDVEKVPPLAGLGPEPLDPDFTTERLAAILAEGGHTLKGMLTDQRAMAGVGNAWSDDVLHRAKMSPFARPKRLDEAGVERLPAALVSILTEARATLAAQVGDEVVIPKASERLFAVHGRAGAACYVCGDTIRSVWMGDRETSYCPTCQTGGRILADRRRSRFLR